MTGNNGSSVQFPHLPSLRFEGDKGQDWEVTVALGDGGVTLCPDGLYLERAGRYEFVPAMALFQGLDEPSASLFSSDDASIW